MNSNLSVFVFPSISCIFGVPSKKPLPYPKHTKIYSHVFFRILIILDIIFKSMIHFELDFFIGVSYGFNFSFTCGYTVVPIPFVENSILFPLSCFGMFLENHLTQSFTFILIAGINILIFYFIYGNTIGPLLHTQSKDSVKVGMGLFLNLEEGKPF